MHEMNIPGAALVRVLRFRALPAHHALRLHPGPPAAAPGAPRGGHVVPIGRQGADGGSLAGACGPGGGRVRAAPRAALRRVRQRLAAPDAGPALRQAVQPAFSGACEEVATALSGSLRFASFSRFVNADEVKKNEILIF